MTDEETLTQIKADIERNIPGWDEAVQDMLAYFDAPPGPGRKELRKKAEEARRVVSRGVKLREKEMAILNKMSRQGKHAEVNQHLNEIAKSIAAPKA